MLQHLSAMGVSASTLAFMTHESLAKQTDDPDDEVPRLYKIQAEEPEKWREPPYPNDAPRRKAEYYTISRDEWVEVEAPNVAADKIDEQLAEIDSTGQIGGLVTKRTNNHHAEPVVDVRLTTVYRIEDGEKTVVADPDATEEEVRAELPDTIDATVGDGEYERTKEDIPVTVSSEEIEEQGCGRHDCDTDSWGAWYNADYDDIPGGCQFQDAKGGRATLCTPAWHSAKEEMVMTTAAHTVMDDDEDYPEGRNVYQSYRYANKIGETSLPIVYYRADVEDYWERYCDAAVVEMTESHNTYHALADTSGEYAENIQGIVGFDYIKDNMGSDTLCRQGRTTGRCEGSISSYKDTQKKAYFKTTASSESGDSGGPHFKMDDGKAIIAGIHYGGDATAYPMERFEEDFGITVP